MPEAPLKRVPKKRPTKKPPQPTTVEVTPTPVKPAPRMLTGATYDWFNKSAQLFFPALGALYFTLAQLWGFPKAEEVTGTIAALNLFLGVIVTISRSRYYNSDARFAGAIDISEQNAKTLFSLNLDDDPESLKDMKEVTFKIKK